MGPHYATIIAPLAGDSAAELKDYLRRNANPQVPDPGSEGLRCTPDFPFDRIPTLHFCSLLVLDADPDAGIPAQVVLDATFDGTREAFLHDLLIAAPVGMHEVFRHCRGYPHVGAVRDGSGLSLSERTAFHAYLLSHDVGASAYFSGSPGRTVGQIREEHRLRAALGDELAARRLGPMPMPATNTGLQKVLQDRVTGDPLLAFAKTEAPEPWQVRWREALAKAVGWAGVAVLAALGALLLGLLGLGPACLFADEPRLLDYAGCLGRALAAWGYADAGRTVSGLAYPLATALAVLVLVRIVARACEFWIEQQLMDPHRQANASDALSFVAYFVRLAVTALIAIFAALVLAVGLDPSLADVSPAVINEIAMLRDFMGLAGPVSVWCTLTGLALAVIALAVMSWTATTLRLAQERSPASHVVARKLAGEVVKLAEVFVLLLGAILLVRHFTDCLQPVLSELACLARLAAVGLAWIAAGLAVPTVALALVLALIRLHEWRDARSFSSADELLRVPLGNAVAREREERGTNICQNHLASITYVKPGIFRLALLRLTLWLIGLLARYWFNQGELGGIPTILSARWVVIDNGRRLIFLDNYGGGWESYLNEFIDMGAVKGLNAIWTNTFIKWRRKPGDPLERVAFPETRYATARGAQAERPFKHYVRLSQLETIAWYSAYHTLSIVNINTSSEIRRQLFEPLESHEVDALVSHL